MRRVVLQAVLVAVTAAWASGAVIDHTCTDLDRVPAYWIRKAKSTFRVAYGHTSHGGQIISGMDILNKTTPLYRYDRNGASGGLSLHDRTPSGDLGDDGDLSWRDRTIEMLNSPTNDRNMVVWAWCDGASSSSEAEIDAYLAAMSGLEAAYPGVAFVYMTGHLNGTGVEGVLHRNNERIRAYCIQNNKTLYDFADIESYDPDGNGYLERFASAACDYDVDPATGLYTRNWADEWCAANPSSDLCARCSCAHSRKLNCHLKARAFWWMLARLAGWSGNPAWDQATDMGQGWLYLSWLGIFQAASDPWVYHSEHGWMYVLGTRPASLWIWMPGPGWCWTGEGTYPYLCRASDGVWLWYVKGTARPRLFVNAVTLEPVIYP
jgi:hypothetical protein